MDIQPYLTIIKGQKLDQPRRTERVKDNSLRLVEAASADPIGRDVVEVVSLENRRALAQAPPKDLGAAEAVLSQAREQLMQINREDLRKIHRLEGLVHVYAPYP